VVIVRDCYGLRVPMNVRVTAVITEGDQILLLDQDTESDRSWSLPGGKVEPGETVEEALEREVREETGLEIRVGDLLYVCDVVQAHVVHLTFECRRVGGTLGAVTPGADTRPIRAVEFVKLSDLPSLGFSERFVELAQKGWPDAGSYMGPKANIGL
jgi:ADP-ribose pyrophosphatase YjhB (NUDIX family)